jgi:hypothetical protein
MKPSEMVRQMKALLPPDPAAGTYFMAAFLLRLPADMIDHIISQDFNARRRGNTVAAAAPSMRTTIQQSTAVPAAAAERAHHTTDAAVRRPARGAAAGRPPAVQRRQRHLLLPHHLRRTGEEVQAWPPVGPGKRVGRGEINTLGGGMIFLQDDDSKQQFMEDTGAVSSHTVPKRSQLASSSPAPTAEQSHHGVPSAAYRFGCARFLLPFFSPPYTDPS